MPLDPNIILQQRQADPTEAYGRAVRLKSLMWQQAMQDMQLEQARQQQEQERTLADLYRGNIGADGQVNLQGVLGAMAQRGLGGRIPGVQKQWAEADKAGAELGQVKAKTAVDEIKAEHEKAKYVGDTMARLASNPNITHDDVIRELANVPPQFAENAARLVRSLPGDPRQLRQYLLTIGLEADKRLAAITPKFEQINAGNRVLTGSVDPLTGAWTQQGAPIVKAPEGYIVGPDGRLTVDPGFQASKEKIAAAGKSQINLAVNTEKSLTNEMAQGLGKQLDSSLADATAAGSQITNARNLLRLIDSGKIIAGPGADARIIATQIGSALGVTGRDAEERLANTRQAIQGLAQAELTAAASMKGQGAITDGERAILKKAAAGDISMSPAELRAMSQAIERNANARINLHQQQVQRLGALPGAAPLMPFYAAPQVPGEPQQAPAQPAPPARGGAQPARPQPQQPAARPPQQRAPSVSNW